MEEGKRFYDVNDIREVLPHTFPFLMIDRVTEMDAGISVKAYKNVTFNESFMQGHFKQFPVMPGALIIECMAQAGAFSVLSVEKNKGKIIFLAGVNNMKFRGSVVPGDRLDLEVKIGDMHGPFGIGLAKALVDGKVVASGEITFCIMDADKGTSSSV